MATDVWRIKRYAMGSGLHGVSRREQRVFEKVTTFQDIEEAKTFVYNSTVKAGTHLPYYGAGCTRDQIMAFCFTDERMVHHREYFIGKPPKQAIQQALNLDGVRVHCN